MFKRVKSGLLGFVLEDAPLSNSEVEIDKH